MTDRLPTHAEIVIVGGGIIGCSTAYHLAKLGKRDVVLVEQGSLSCGTTWHAAGLVGQLRHTQNLTNLIRHSARLYETLEAETGQATGWKRCGSLNVARSEARLVELKRGVAMANAFGIEAEIVSPVEAGRMWPLMRTDDLHGAAWIPSDGKANPADLTQALAKGAKQGGVRIFERVKVTGVRTARGAVAGVETDQGAIACEVLVNCAGQWAKRVGRMAGVAVPLHSAEHMYIVTKAIPGVTPDLPVMRDHDGYVYFKEEVGGLVMGGFEPEAKPWGMGGIPDGFAFQLLPEDWEQFEILMVNAINRVPALESAEVRQLLNGPESFTPDGHFIMGEAPGLRNFFVGAGFNSAGIASAGGAGMALAEWIVGGRQPFDLWPVDIRRFARFQDNDSWLRTRTVESLGMHYAHHWPHLELESARPLRISPLYERLKARGACFGSKLGWERPNWFAPEGVEPRNLYAFGRQNWFPHSGAEHRAAREAVVVFDQTSFGKILVQGRDAEQVMQRLCANEVGVEPGRVVYTGMLNEAGGYESDLTVTRLAEDAYLAVTGSGQAIRDLDWIRRNIPAEAHAFATDVTSAWAVLSVMGPRSRALLSSLSRSDLSNAAFPFGTAQEIDLGFATVRAHRISYVGELGWELYVPVEFAAHVYDRLVEAGEAFGLRNAGYYALESLRTEKAYRAWGHDVSPDDTPFEAGLGFAVKLDKAVPFLGREALLRRRDERRTKRLVVFLLEEEAALPFGEEPILHEGRIVGHVTSAYFGHSVGRAVALGYVHHPAGVDADLLAAGGFAIDVAGERFSTRAQLQPPFDPKGERLKR